MLIKAWIMYFLMGLSGSILMFSSSPVVSVITILAMTSFLCIFMFEGISLSIFPYVTFLIFLGGLMVLFTYMCSIASNEKYIKSSLTLSRMAATSLVSLSIWSLSFKTPQNADESVMKASMKLFSSCSETLYFYLFFYLLFTLFVCVLLSKKKEGAVRMKSN